MKRWFIGAVTVLVAALLLVGYLRALPDAVRQQREGRLRRIAAACDDALRPAGGNERLAAGQPAPAFELQDWAGRKVTLASLRGRIVLIHLWATWCPTCTVEIPSLERLHQAEAGRPFSLLAISVDEGWPEVRRFFAHGSPLTVLLDQGQEVAARYGVEKFPESFLLDRDGRILFYVVSDRDWSSERVRACIDAALD